MSFILKSRLVILTDVAHSRLRNASLKGALSQTWDVWFGWQLFIL